MLCFRCLFQFDVPNIEFFHEKFSMLGTSKILCKSLSVIEAYDQIKSAYLFIYQLE